MARLTIDQLLARRYSGVNMGPDGFANATLERSYRDLARAIGYTGEILAPTRFTVSGFGESGEWTREEQGTKLAPQFRDALSRYTFETQDRGDGRANIAVFDPSGSPVGSYVHGDKDSGLDRFMERAIPLGLGALAGGAALGLFGGAPAAAAPGAITGGGGLTVGGSAGYGSIGGTLGGAGGTTLGVAGSGMSAGAGLNSALLQGLAATGAASALPAGFAEAGGLAGSAGSAGGSGLAGAAGTAASTAAGAADGAGFWGSALKTVAPVLGSVAGGIIQSNAASNAADAQSAAARQAAEAVQKALQPYQQAGADALAGQRALVGLNGNAAQQSAIDAIKASPAFTSMQALGENRILQNASATGGLRGGNVQGALAQFSPQLLAQLIEQRYSQLGGLAGNGLSAAGAVGGAQAGAAGQIGSAQAGNALARGNALNNIAASGFGALGQYLGQQSAAPSIAPVISTMTPFGQFQLGGGF